MKKRGTAGKAVPNHGTSAFSLTELLVVMAIASIVMALLLPGLVLSRRQSMTATCINNLRQIGFALENYATDQDDLIPPELISDQVLTGMQTAMTSRAFFPAAHAADAGLPGSMDPYYEDVRVVKCPGQKTDEKLSYGMNGQVCTIVERFRDIENPSQTPMVFDSKLKMGFHYSDMSMRHIGVANVLYADTHVEQVYFDTLFNFDNSVRLPGGPGGIRFQIDLRTEGTNWDSVDIAIVDYYHEVIDSLTMDRDTGNPDETAHFDVMLDPFSEYMDLEPRRWDQAKKYYVHFRLYIGDEGSGNSGKPKQNIGGTPFKIQINGDGFKLFTTLNNSKPTEYAEITDMLQDAAKLN